MRRIAAIFLAAVAVIAIGIAAAPFLVSSDFIRTRVAGAISELTGRPVTIAGDANLSIYPRLAVTVEDITVGSANDGGDPFVVAESAAAGLRLWPLLLGRVAFDQVDLTRARLHLIVTKDGNNWDLSGSSVAANPGDTPLPGMEAPLSRLTLVDATVVYDDRVTAERQEITGIGADFRWPAYALPITGRATATWREAPLEANGIIAQPLALLRGEPSAVRLAFAATPLRVRFSGTTNTSDGQLALDGDGEIISPSLRTALEWMGLPMGTSPILGAGAIRGHALVSAGKVAFDAATVELDGNSATGALSLDLSGPRPAVSATLAADRFDVSPYVEAARADVNSTGPWVTVPATLPAVDTIDGELRLTAGEVRIGSVKAGRTVLTLVAKDGRLNGAITESEFAGGILSAALAAVRQGELLAARVRVTIARAEVDTLLNATVGSAALSGTGTITVDLNSRARFWGGFVAGITGSGALEVADGKLYGFDLPQAGLDLADPLADKVERGAGSTPFKRLQATISVERSRLITDDLAMSGDGYRFALKGGGALLTGIVEGTADIRVGSASSTVMLSGTWSNPAIARAIGFGAPGPTTAPTGG